MTQSPISNPLPLVSLDEASEFRIPDISSAAARPGAPTASGIVLDQRPGIETEAAARPLPLLTRPTRESAVDPERRFVAAWPTNVLQRLLLEGAGGQLRCLPISPL